MIHVLLSTILFSALLCLLALVGNLLLQWIKMAPRNAVLWWSLSLICGVVQLIITVNALGHIIPFPAAVWTVLIIDAGLVTAFRRHIVCGTKLSWSARQKMLAAATFCGVGAALTYIHIGTHIYDAHAHQALAYTFLSGNLPPKSPWYPDFFMPYHYAFMILMSASKVVARIEILYSNDPWHVVLTLVSMSFVFGVLYEYTKKFVVASMAALFFVFGYGLVSVNLFKIVLENVGRELSLGGLLQMFTHINQAGFQESFFAASLRWPVVLEVPVLLTALLFVTEFVRNDSTVLQKIVTGVLFGFIALCEESLFVIGASAVALVLVWINVTRREHRLDKPIYAGIWIGLPAVFVALLQGGFFTTSLLINPLKMGSVPTVRGFHTFSFGWNFIPQFRGWPVTQYLYDANFWYLVDGILLTGVVILTGYLVVKKKGSLGVSLHYMAVYLGAIFISGFLAATFVHWSISPKQMDRMYYFWIPWLFTGALMGWLLERSRYRWHRWCMVVCIGSLLSGSLLFTLSLAGTATGYLFFSKQKKLIEEKIRVGNWLNDHLPHNVRLSNFDPRYSGLMSHGGNRYLDKARGLDDSLKQALERLDLEYYRRHNVTHIYLDTATYDPGVIQYLIHRSELVPIPGPFEAHCQLYAIGRKSHDDPK